ncbi:MAG: isoaspartyl peptidase/L-asparaginase [Armatimonadota bacterium]
MVKQQTILSNAGGNLPYNTRMISTFPESSRRFPLSAVRAVLVIHGGAGTILRENLTPRLEAEHLEALEAALRIGYSALQSAGGSSLDGVAAAVQYLEDCPLFNAGRGSVFTHDGSIEMDAAVMDGGTGKAGAVTGVRTVRNPVLLARKVLEQSPFAMLAGTGAEAFAASVGIPRTDPEYFRTEDRWQQLQTQLRHETENATATMSLSEDNKFGTVGAVAVDRGGNVAAATSTGGMTNKRYGRIGDSPVIGAGTWAENATCAVSATGHGEYFIRHAAAHDIAARMAYAGRSVSEAAYEVIHERLMPVGGAGGVIAIDANGNATLPFNTAGMYRGYITESGETSIAIYSEDA